MEDQPLSMSIKIIKDDTNPLAIRFQLKDNLENLLATATATARNNSSRPSIYKVPDYVTQVQPKAFKPQLVSLGPYHYGDPRLLPMEQHKHRAFFHFQKSCGFTIESIVERVSNMLEYLQGSYDKLDRRWMCDPAEFLQLMIVDACFVFQVLNLTTIEGSESDPIFSPHGQLHMYSHILRDMLLLENQLPMKLLDEMCSIRNQNQQQQIKVEQLVWQCFFSEVKIEIIRREYLHVLDMYREKLLTPRKKYRKQKQSKKNGDEDVGGDLESQIIRSATELHEAGIRFKRSKSESVTDIYFDEKKGMFWLPQIIVDDRSESTMLNVMAFEKLHVGVGNEVTNYIYLMDNLIDVDKDVALLTSKKIMLNGIGSDKAAAKLFNLLANGATLDQDSHLNDVQNSVIEHCKRPCNEWLASLTHTYFQNPWAIISLMAAVLGFALLILQTVYDIYGYHHPLR